LSGLRTLADKDVRDPKTIRDPTQSLHFCCRRSSTTFSSLTQEFLKPDSYPANRCTALLNFS
jgi:hypothetical protein